MSGEDVIQATGSLRREGGGFVLVADGGGRLPLELPRTPVDLVGKRARIAGVRGPGGAVIVEAIGPG